MIAGSVLTKYFRLCLAVIEMQKRSKIQLAMNMLFTK